MDRIDLRRQRLIITEEDGREGNHGKPGQTIALKTDDPHIWRSRTLPQSRRGKSSRDIGLATLRRNLSIVGRLMGLLPCYYLAFALVLHLCQPASAAYVNFQNCLGKGTTNADPLPLQFVPYFVNAVFNNSDGAYNLNVTVYGNVAGLATLQVYPAPDNPQWTNDTEYVGKITDLSPTNPKPTASTLQVSFDVLSYSPYNPGASRFCQSLVQGHCPLAPVFDHNVSHPANLSDPKQLRAFSVAHDLNSPFIFTSIASNTRVITGDTSKSIIACVLADITPDLGDTVRRLVRFLPALILAFVAAAVATAAVWSPWGSNDVFRFTSNYGRDQDLLRLVTPGFGDCLQYIQFIVLSGSLTLNYPGYYQPVVSAASWSILMFNQSFVSNGTPHVSIQDGIYTVNGTYGLETTSELVGMSSTEDIWAGMIIWLLIIIVATTALAQAGFIYQWGYHQVTKTQQEDLRSKNVPFSIGNAIRITLSYFYLPLVSLSMFQLVEARHSSKATVALAAIVVIFVVIFTLRMFVLFVYTRPRSYLFDDLPTVLLYGPLYNTYSDHAAAFALVPLLLTFMRGIAFGAVQPSGIVQLVILAICEVAFILTLNAFRPFQSPTSMNAIHTVFAIVRLVTIMLSVAFVPSLDVTNSIRGWIGYVILFLHAAALFVGFFLHSLQTIVEVIARAAGAGGEEGVGGGATRGGLVKVFGMRQLSRRHPRRPRGPRNSIASDAAFFNHDNDQKSVQMNSARSRSMSNSSAILLNRQNPSEGRQSVTLDSMTGGRGGHSHSSSVAGIPTTPVTGGSQSGFSNSAREPQRTTQAESSVAAGPTRVKSGEAGTGPWYRPPRQRRVTMELPSPGTRSRLSWASSDWAKNGSPQSPEQEDDITEAIDGPLMPVRDSPSAAHFGTRERPDSVAGNSERAKTDYAIREVDFYYGVRGPALSTSGTRKLKTGPADPTGPVSSASNWFKSLLGGKSKEKNKGFEVVRSSRMPPPVETPPGEIALQDQKPYKDDPESATSPRKTRDFELEDEGGAVGAGTIHVAENNPTSPHSSETEAEDSDPSSTSDDDEDPEDHRGSQISQFPPSLPSIDTGPTIELPSRIASKASTTKPSRSTARRREQEERPPEVPRKSSKRKSVSPRIIDSRNRERLAMITPSPPDTPYASPPGHLPYFHTRNISSSLSLSRPDSPAQPQRPRQSSAQSSARGASRRPSGAAVVSAFSEDLPPTDGQSSRSDSPFQTSSGRGGAGGHESRPSSLGFVQQHRARDTIHLVNPTHPLTQGSIAELVDAEGSKSPEGRE